MLNSGKLSKHECVYSKNRYRLIPSSMVMDTIRKHISQCALYKQQTVTKHDKRNEKVSMFLEEICVPIDLTCVLLVDC